LTSDLTLLAGGRFSHEHKSFDYGTDLYTPASLFLPPSAGTFVAPIRSYANSSSEPLSAGKVQLNWKPQKDVLLYGGFNRGVKAGSYNAPLGGGAGLVPDSALPYGPEVLNDYETGFKTDWLSHQLRVNGSTFFYDYKGYQTFKITNLAQQVLNADATVKGAELEVAAAPARGLDLSVAASYLDMRVKNINYDGVIKDRQNSFTPKWQMTSIARYSWDIGNSTLAVQADVKYTSLTYFSISNFDVAKMPAYWLTNARVSFQPADRHWEFDAFVDNLANRYYKIVGFDLSADCGCSFIGYGKPRWAGVSAKYSY
jgi:iron complex outermembrane receptor protein